MSEDPRYVYEFMLTGEFNKYSPYKWIGDEVPEGDSLMTGW